MSDSEWTKICGVCGDKAIAKNFGAVSCESCKAFFRRNASKMNVYKCYFDNKCKIDAITRKFCRRCRLRKCFEIGMKQEWILSEEQKQMRRKKIEAKKQVRKNSLHSSGGSDSTTVSSPDTHDSDTLDLFESNISDDEIITNIIEIEKYIHNEENDKNDEISDEVYQKAVELEFAVLPIARPLPNNSNTFNEMECTRLTELFSAMNIIKTTPQDVFKLDQLANPNEMCSIMGKKLDRDIRSLVAVSKGLDAFNKLCENDQISLLKHGSTDVFCMRAITSMNFETNYWTIVVDDNQSISIKMELFMNDKHCCMFNQLQHYFKKMSKEYDSDNVIIDLLTAVVLFNPDRPNLIHKETVKLQQQVYMYLLQRYLLLKYRSECVSKEMFLRLINTLNDLKIISSLKISDIKSRRGKNPEFLGPLAREVLDIGT